MSDSVFIYYQAESCPACKSFSYNWANVMSALKKEHPKMLVVVIKVKTIGSPHDFNEFPKDLKKYVGWYPTFILVPRPSWDEAMKKLGPNSTFELKGVKVMNGNVVTKDGKFAVDMVRPAKYSTKNANDFSAWVTDMMKGDDFKNPVIPQPVLPVAVPKVTAPLIKPAEIKEPEKLTVCTMRIVPRPNK